MSRARFLLDEHLGHHLVRALRRKLEGITVRRIGDEGTLPLGSADPDVLAFCEREEWLLVSLDRATMPMHTMAHLEAGGHVPGVFLAAQRMSNAQIVDELLLIWENSEYEEWRDLLIYLPL